MLKDYYAILGISAKASAKEIRDAYRELSLKWHPDRNPGKDTEEIMKDVNEAYSILKDEKKRARYNKEYENLNSFKTKANSDFNSNSDSDTGTGKASHSSYTYDYTVQDEDLENDIYEARKEAEDFVKEFFDNLKSDSKKAANGAWKAMKPFLYLFVFTIGLMLLSLIIAAILG